MSSGVGHSRGSDPALPIAVAVQLYSDSTPSLGTSICRGYSPKKQKNKKIIIKSHHTHTQHTMHVPHAWTYHTHIHTSCSEWTLRVLHSVPFLLETGLSIPLGCGDSSTD